MKVLVTGGAGFIGRETVKLLGEAGHQVAVIDNLSAGDPGQLQPEIKLYDADIRANLTAVFKQELPEAVIHLAAQKSVPASVDDPVDDFTINGQGTLNVLEACKDHGVKRFVFASSAAVYGDTAKLPISEEEPAAPISPYGISKHAGELYTHFYHHQYGLATVVLRYANVYGPDQKNESGAGPIPIFIEQALKDETPKITGDGSQTRDFIYVLDAARANVLALNGPGGITVNIGSGEETSILAIWQKIARLIGCRAEARFVKGRPGDICRSLLDSTSAAKILGFSRTISLEQGLKLCIEAARERMNGRAT